MKGVGRYCKAYALSAFERYHGWTASARTDVIATADFGGDERYLFLHDTLVVTADTVPDESIVFDAVSSQWEAFCRQQLEFEVPEECLGDEALDEQKVTNA